ncbi:MAG: cobalamin-binding protein [Saprospiraceae bacterium]|nr:cobalamin-binding protein [Pyrinomonadaceae bacterium]
MKNLRFIKFFTSCFIFCVIVTTGCNDRTQPVAVETNVRLMTDDLGRSVKIPAKVERAISLAPNLTEIVFAVGAGDKLVGVTSFCNYPAEAQSIQKVSDTLTPNIENIIALKPQVVFVSTASQLESFMQTLDEQNIAVFVTAPDAIEGIYKSILDAGSILGTETNAEEVVTGLKKRVSVVESSTAEFERPKVFVQIDKNALYTIGKESFITDIIRRAGGVSVTADVGTAYPKLSKETALALRPDVIILSESDGNREPNEVFKNSPAVRNGKVFSVDADLLSRPGPRVVDALEKIAKYLHP